MNHGAESRPISGGMPPSMYDSRGGQTSADGHMHREAEMTNIAPKLCELFRAR
jgi:hypothetical protein